MRMERSPWAPRMRTRYAVVCADRSRRHISAAAPCRDWPCTSWLYPRSTLGHCRSSTWAFLCNLQGSISAIYCISHSHTSRSARPGGCRRSRHSQSCVPSKLGAPSPTAHEIRGKLFKGARIIVLSRGSPLAPKAMKARRSKVGVCHKTPGTHLKWPASGRDDCWISCVCQLSSRPWLSLSVFSVSTSL